MCLQYGFAQFLLDRACLLYSAPDERLTQQVASGNLPDLMHLLRLHRAFCGRGRASTPGKVCRRQHNYTIGIAVRPAHSVCTAKRNTRGRCSASADVPSKECPVIPPPRFNEEYFVFPYPSADTQVGRRVDRKGDWFERTPFYPLPKHWTKAPEVRVHKSTYLSRGLNLQF